MSDYLVYKHYDRIIRFDGLGEGLSLEEFHDQCRYMAGAIGYHPDSIEGYFNTDEDLVNSLHKKIIELERDLRVAGGIYP